MQGGKVNFIIDGQWGSTGKGKLAGYLATHHEVGMVISNFMPNAGHTYIDSTGRKYVSKCIPTAAVNRDAEVYLSPNSLIDIDRLMEEIEMFDCANRLSIHPHAAILDPSHKQAEQEGDTENRISSTQQGCGAALAQKIRRRCRDAVSEPRLKGFVRDWAPELQMRLDYGHTALFESAQGFDLSLNWGLRYPYTTSRDITIGSLLSDAGVHILRVGDIYGSIRVNPIRVGNVVKDGKTVGFSGPHYVDQTEMTWEDVTKESGSPEPLQEITTVTGKVRRVFTFSWMQLMRFLYHCGPTKMFVNFVNYIDWNDYQKTEWIALSKKTKNFIVRLNSVLKGHLCKVSHIGTGENNEHMVTLP